MRELVYQAQEKGCGFATVKMALIHMSKDRRYAFLPEPLVAEAPDLATLISYAEQAGLRLRGCEAPYPEEIARFAGFPILIILREEGRLHMAFLRGRSRGRYLVLDPVRGKRTMDQQDLLTAWTGQFLSIEGYEKKGESLCHIWDPPVLPEKGALLALTLLPMASALLGFAFLDFSFPPYATLACLIASLALSLALKARQLRAMEDFDRRYMDGVDAEDLTRRRELFVRYHAYKRAAFVTQYDVLGRVAMVGAALIFLCFHDMHLAGACASASAIAALGHLCLDPKFHALRQKAAEQEGAYLSTSLGEGSRKEMRKGLGEVAKRFGLGLSLWNGFMLLSGVSLAVAFCLFQGVFNPQIVTFYLLATVGLSLEVDKLFLNADLLDQRRKEEPFFLLNIASRVKT